MGRDAYGSRSPFFCFQIALVLLHIYLNFAVELEQGAFKDVDQALLVFVVVLNDQIQHHNHQVGQYGVEGIDHEHDPDRQEEAGEGKVPARFEFGAVGRGRTKVVEKGNETEGAVGDEEKHGDDFRNDVYVTQGDK